MTAGISFRIYKLQYEMYAEEKPHSYKTSVFKLLEGSITMRIIQTLADIKCLGKADVFNDAFIHYLEDLLCKLHQELSVGEPIETFSLNPHGPIIILEKGDNLMDLSAVGLDSKGGGLTGTVPEFIENINLLDLNMFRALVIYNNSYAVSFFFSSDCLTEQTSDWVNNHLS